MLNWNFFPPYLLEIGFGARLHDDMANVGRPGESEFPDPGVIGQSLPGHAAGAGDNVDHASGDSGPMQYG